MATTVTTGTSTHSDEHRAAQEALGDAMADDLGPPDLLLAFATVGYDQQDLLDAIAEASGGCPLVGCSGEGIISRGGSDEGSYCLSVMAWWSDELSFAPVVAEGLAQGSGVAGQALATQLETAGASDGKLLLVFPDGLTANTSQLFDGLTPALPAGCVVAGGTSGDRMTLDQTYQYHGGQVYSDAVTGVLISGPVQVETTVSHGCQPIGRERTVTAAKANMVLEIDGEPAFEVFKEYVDDDPDELRAEDIVHMCFGERLPDAEAQGYDEYIIRTPLGLDPATGGLQFPVELGEGTPIQMTRRDPEMISRRAGEAARSTAGRHPGQDPLAVLQFDCAGRGGVLFGSKVTEHAVTPLQEAFGPTVPWLGFHTYGEIAPLAGQTRFHNYTVALCALYEA